MRRIGLAVVLTVGIFAAPLGANAQPPTKVARIGCLWSGSASAFSSRLQTFRESLRELGYREGQTVALECRFADGKFDRLPALAAEVVNLKPDVIVTAGDASIRAARQATRTIPIVVANSGDLVGPGHVASLARPGGNVTGLVDISPELGAKRMQLLKEAIPKTTRVAILWNPTNPVKVADAREVQTAASALGIRVLSVEARNASDLEPGFAAMARGRVDALLVSDDALIINNRKRIVDLAARIRLPAIYFNSAWAHAGGLMAYGPSEPETYRRAATYVDKILKGAKPADLPVEQPTKFELVINLKTAKALGLAIPQSVLLRADEVIQ
jgi:putative tryptophan/tyrosine transport system substrate-binding protein